MLFESLEPRRLLSTVTVTAKAAAAYESGPVTRFFYIRRDISDLSQPLSVFYTVGGKAKQGVDYNPIGTGITIKAGDWLRRVEVTPISDQLDENNEAVTLTINGTSDYTIIDQLSATIRIISFEDTPAPPQPPQQPPAPTSITWSTVAPNPIIRAEALRAVVDGKLYTFGGFLDPDGPVKRSDVFDPVANTWTQIADLPTRLTHAGVAVDGHDVYFVGGYVGIGATGYNQTFGVTQVWKYNTDSNQYTAIAALPAARAGGGAAVINHTLFYFSGDDGSRNDAATMWSIDLTSANPTWGQLADIPDARSHMGYVTMDGKIYAMGGQHGNDEGLTTVTTVNVYDPVTNMWATLAALPVAVSHIASAGVVLDGRIIIAGGETAHEQASNRVTIYDPGTNTWSSLTPLPATRFSGVAAIIDGVLYFTTGSSQTTTYKGVFS
jgi:N-acetylneuraminic acid mutarotase